MCDFCKNYNVKPSELDWRNTLAQWILISRLSIRERVKRVWGIAAAKAIVNSVGIAR